MFALALDVRAREVEPRPTVSPGPIVSSVGDSQDGTVGTGSLGAFGVHELIFVGVPIAEFGEYRLVPRGGTALPNAMGRTISTVSARLEELQKERCPTSVTVAGVTDGLEKNVVITGLHRAGGLLNLDAANTLCQIFGVPLVRHSLSGLGVTIATEPLDNLGARGRIESTAPERNRPKGTCGRRKTVRDH